MVRDCQICERRIGENDEFYYCWTCPKDEDNICTSCYYKSADEQNHGNHRYDHAVIRRRNDDDNDYSINQYLWCNGCGHSGFNIAGTLFHCVDCHNFDLCERCYKTRNYGPTDQHIASHRVQELLSPLHAKAGKTHDAVKCSLCLSWEYSGRRYMCKDCKLDACERCFKQLKEDLRNGNANTQHALSHNAIYYEPKDLRCSKFRHWKASSMVSHYYFAQTLGRREWDLHDQWNADERRNLAKNIGFALFGEPTINAEEDDESYWGYTKKQEETITELRNFLEEISEEDKDKRVCINYIFVSFYMNGEQNMMPMFRLKTHGGCYFIEVSGRTYKSWSDFVDKNLLPECDICYPKNGWYSPNDDGTCPVVFGKSAECDTSRQIAKVADVAGATSGISALLMVGASFLFPPAAPVLLPAAAVTGAASGGVLAGRSGYKLIDAATHRESINPFASRRAFFNWLGFIGPLISFGTAGTTAFISSASNSTLAAMGPTTRFAVNTLLVGNLAVGGAHFLGSYVNLIIKADKGEKITSLDVFQLCASALFFTGAVVNFQTASKLITATQNSRITDYAKFMTQEQRVGLDALYRQNQQRAVSSGASSGTGAMHAGRMTLAELDALVSGDFANFRHLSELASSFTIRDVEFNRVAGRFPIRSTGNLGVEHILNRHGEQFAQRGFSNTSDGVIEALNRFIRDENFYGNTGDGLVTYWRTDSPDHVLAVVMTQNVSRDLALNRDILMSEIVTAYFTSPATANNRIAPGG